MHVQCNYRSVFRLDITCYIVFLCPASALTEPGLPEQIIHPSNVLQFVGAPVGYVQQIVVKSTVTPWDSERLVQTDAFRAPLATAFSLLEHISSFRFMRGWVPTGQFKMTWLTFQLIIFALCLKISLLFLLQIYL